MTVAEQCNEIATFDYNEWISMLVLSERDYVTFVYVVTYLSICLSSVCDVRASYSADWNFRQCFYAILYPGYPLTSVQNFTEIVSRKPLRQGLNASGVAKYNNVGRVEGYISDMVQDTASNTIYDKWEIIPFESNDTTLDPLGWPLISVLGLNLGKPFISLKLIELWRITLTLW